MESNELRLFDDPEFDDPRFVDPRVARRKAKASRERPIRTLEPEPSLQLAPPTEPQPESKPITGRQLAVQPFAVQPFTVRIERSAKRRRTVGAQLNGDVLKIVVPTWMSRTDQDHWVEVMSRRFLRKLSTDRIDLADRASTLSRRHDLPRPREIRWSDDMRSRWGSCTPATGTIRISTRIARFPDWVIDYVLVHELAHLEVADHSEAFWRLAHRYPKAERSIGFLIAKSGNDSDAD